MSTIKQIMLDEWRYWWRTKLATTVIFIGVILTLASVIVSTTDMRQAAAERTHLQQASEARFLEQPDRHPHRMVHYGHYVFRAPSPLSMIEPGVDAYTGTSIFLEGHRQNSAMFADQRQSSGLTRFSSLSPAFIMQVLAPLLMILVGYACITREKEAGTLNIMMTQGVKKHEVLFGKFLALIGSGLLVLVPLVLASIWANVMGESIIATTSFVLGYFIYILIWGAIVLWVSTFSSRKNTSFASLICLWITLCILIPRISSSTAASIVPSSGKLEADFAVFEELRKLGNGHNASDPAFNQLKANLLAKYDANGIEDLPVNFRGVVAQYSEEKLTKVLNRFAETRMQEELSQAKIARYFGWLSPMVTIRTFSMMMAGTNLETHHRFLREAESLRYEFVQSLNHLHQHKLDYHSDVNRYKEGVVARVDASNWNLLSSFSFKPQAGITRLQQSLLYGLQLLFWCVVILLLIKRASQRIEQ